MNTIIISCLFRNHEQFVHIQAPRFRYIAKFNRYCKRRTILYFSGKSFKCEVKPEKRSWNKKELLLFRVLAHRDTNRSVDTLAPEIKLKFMDPCTRRQLWSLKTSCMETTRLHHNEKLGEQQLWIAPDVKRGFSVIFFFKSESKKKTFVEVHWKMPTYHFMLHSEEDNLQKFIKTKVTKYIKRK